ncbi:MAG: S-adenosyl-l-methionine hydroxide adenosyltransferase family protein [Pleurocapsa sp.]
MNSQGMVTLLTDFGRQDVYVGVMKGVIASINPHLQVIDLTHEIPPQNIAAARFCLLNAYSYFPSHTVHIAVVDPGVGSQRRSVAIAFEDGLIVCPDNGLCSGVLQEKPAIAAVELTNARYWRTANPSSTFHGRDIFAPVGAHLASGVALTALGNEIDPDSLIKLSLPRLQRGEREIIGCIQYIDHFGNLISNIPGKLISNQSWQAEVKNLTIVSGNTYSDVASGETIAIVGSHGWIEIAVNGGNARQKLQLMLESKIKIKFI